MLRNAPGSYLTFWFYPRLEPLKLKFLEAQKFKIFADRNKRNQWARRTRAVLKLLYKSSDFF